MKKIAYLFPGQGAQFVGMGKDFAENFQAARQTFEEADDLLHQNLSNIIFNGPDSELIKTKNSQLAIFIVSIAILRTIQSQMATLNPFVCSGLSLGEYTALHASSRLSFSETLHLISHRAQFMNAACEKCEGTMAAVIGIENKILENAIQDIDDVWIANYNCPGQIVISGSKIGIANVMNHFKEKKIGKIIPLSVHGAFHSPFMQTAQDLLTPYIQLANLKESPIGFCMNVTGNFAESVEDVRKNLCLQVTHSVRWEEGILAMEKAGIEQYVEIGCGKTLSGLNRKIKVKAPTFSVEKIADLEVAFNQMESLCNS